MSDFGVPTDEQLVKINRLAKRTLTKDELFVFSGSSAGDMLIPGRHTKLSHELLQVMADDGNKGVSFMLNHNWSSSGVQGIPYGKVFSGRIAESSKEGQSVELFLDKFIARDDESVDGVSANALIKRIETGVLSDTSIGFSTDNMTCSICSMNYWGGKCSHWKGRNYEMADGSNKMCYVTAMPPSIILPYNNNALFEESIVWDGAYPGAMVTQSKHGDIIENSNGKFSILEDKEELPENTPLIGHYHNGNIVTMVKKSDHQKLFKGAKFEDGNKEGSENLMNENLKKMLEAFGVELADEDIPQDVLERLANKWDATVETIKASVEPLKLAEGEVLPLSDEFIGIPVKEIEEKFGTKLSTDDVLKLAKEGQEYHKQTIEDAIAMGVRAQGNDFPADTWKATFATMGTKAIKDIMSTFELQANADIPTGRFSNPANTQKRSTPIPDSSFKL